MVQEFTPTGISISAGIARCAYVCRYCQLDHLKPVKFSVERFAKVVDKFLDYKEKTGFNVGQWLGYTFDLSVEDFDRQLRLYRRSGWDLKPLLLGGVPMMPDDVLKKWFTDRKALGSETVVGSYIGHGEMHDYWNNKKGHFDYQINAHKIALKAGMKNEQRIFMIKSSLPLMEELLDRLEEADINASRVGYLLFYSGLARRYENDRVTMEMLDSQPDRVKAVYRADKEKWKSEKDWVEWARAGKEEFKHDWVSLDVTDENIDALEKMSCEEILDDLTKRTGAAYAAVPSREELCEKYSDRTSEKVYMFMWDMECLWVDRFLKEHPVKFERGLTHFGR